MKTIRDRGSAKRQKRRSGASSLLKGQSWKAVRLDGLGLPAREKKKCAAETDADAVLREIAEMSERAAQLAADSPVLKG